MASYEYNGTRYWKSGNNYGMGDMEYEPGNPYTRSEYGQAMAGYRKAEAAAKKEASSFGVKPQEGEDTSSPAYRQKQLDWMKGNYAYNGWTEKQMNDFLDQIASGNYTDQQKQAMQIWNSVGIGMYNANQQKKQDREDILAEIEAYKAGFSNETIDVAVANERQAWDTKIQGILQQAQQQAAAQGRVMDNTTYAMLRGRLEAQAANAIQATQMQYEQKRQEYMLQAMQMKNDVYKNTTNTVMSYDDAMNIINAMAGKK